MIGLWMWWLPQGKVKMMNRFENVLIRNWSKLSFMCMDSGNLYSGGTMPYLYTLMFPYRFNFLQSFMSVTCQSLTLLFCVASLQDGPKYSYQFLINIIPCDIQTLLLTIISINFTLIFSDLRIKYNLPCDLLKIEIYFYRLMLK